MLRLLLEQRTLSWRPKKSILRRQKEEEKQKFLVIKNQGFDVGSSKGLDPDFQ
jgi:hypothetical protein